ncbi:MAG: phosphatase PAP2 family protein [Candidatus Marinimicrobia bacterium]|nr:phosphatase PAP2 family protein [Candidatus Neomarinimicrobiota bacterium]
MLLSLDLTLFRLINQVWIHPWLDVFFTFITRPETWIPVGLGLSGYLLILGKRKGRVTFLMLLFAFGITDFTAARLIKPNAGRIRPSRLLREYEPLKEKQEKLQIEILSLDTVPPALEDSLHVLTARVRHFEDSLSLTPEKIRVLEHIRRLDGYGGRWTFPSNHAANFFTVAAVLTFFYRKRRFIPWLMAVLVAYSRVYVGRHYPLDVLAGAVLGFVIGRLLCTLWQAWLYQKILAKQKSAETALSDESSDVKS